ncbi:TonB-dependent receptor family protein [Roseateles amylovorans]|uniref:TonB-dependent receptor n=1 Tax=Roseateles amylovorans TaxID=2978473 RepID=A0ABY6BAF6_9BURK|nr:TonB-dependent receptor [Roseateles amylovorans]UXH80555.1 TonB-dependent receptor [Roseateles amylovorans]
MRAPWATGTVVSISSLRVGRTVTASAAAWALACAAAAVPARAQDGQQQQQQQQQQQVDAAPQAGVTLPVVVVSGSVSERALANAPYAVSVVESQTLREAGPMINLSEALTRVPGITANHRQNYAQDLQLSSRGFGARAAFGVRGLRLYTDGIPATMPDGQGQVTHFDLASAQRIEVLRGPFSALYGNSSGGVIALVSAPVKAPQLGLDLDAGSAGLRQARLTAGTPFGQGWEAQASVSGLEVDGFRPQSEARRTLVNGRLGWQGTRDRVLLLFSDIDQRAQDPLGLTAAQFAADPDQTTPQALQFNTRKNASQTQLGGRWVHQFDGLGPLVDSGLTAYVGRRSVTQWQSITTGAQAAPGSGGGVVDFDRRQDGIDARLRWRLGDATLATGLNLERQRDDRQGYENFIGIGASQQLGVTGALRRDEDNRATTREAYAQLEMAVSEAVSASAGVRAGQVRMSARDRYLANGDDSGALRFSYANPALGLGWRLSPALLLHTSIGRGFESPTLNELAYRADGLGGFNTALKPQKSLQQELGLKWRRGTLALDATAFHVTTRDEIGVLTNSGGRSSFQNVGRTRRSGAELSAAWQPAPAWRTQWAVSTLKARYRDAFLTCTGTPCAAANVPVASGNRIAGTQGGSAFAELAWKPAWASDTEGAMEWRGVKRTAVNDINSEWAAGYGLVNLRLSQAWRVGHGQWSLTARIDNLADRRYVGSVIVNDGNGRFYEPAPGRSFWLGLKFEMKPGA